MAAFYANPQYGLVPGAPQGLNWWDTNRFMMSGLALPVPPPLPPVSTAATPTPQDAAAQSAFVPPRTDTGGVGGSGGPGSGPGGLGGASGGGQDRTTSGYQGVYAQSPVDIDSRFGQAGGLLGMGLGGMAGVPGIGTALGIGGAAVDAARYNGTLAQYGLPGNVSVPGSMAAAALASVGIPFTNYDLAHLFGVPTARERMDAVINSLAPGLYNDQGFSAIAANQPNNPSAPFGNTGWGPGMNPTTSQYPSGFLENEAQLGIAARPDVFGSTSGLQGPLSEAQRAALDQISAQDIAARPDIFGSGSTAGGPAPGGQQGIDPTGPGGFGSPGPDPSAGGFGPGAGAGPDAGGAYGPGFWKGGIVGAPPGRYQHGGRVTSPPPITAADVEALRNRLFGIDTAALPMPSYDDERRLQRRVNDPADYAGRIYPPDERATASTVTPPDLYNEHIHHPWPYPDPTPRTQSLMELYGTNPNAASSNPEEAPGAYAAGGAVGRAASNASVRRAPPTNLYVPEPAPPPDAIRDEDFYRGRFTPRPDRSGPIGWNFAPSGAMTFGQAPGTADLNAVRQLPQLYDPSGYYAGDEDRSYATGGAVGRAAARARPQERNLDLPGYQTDRDMSRDAGSQGNWQPPISPAIEQFMNRIELGAARNLPVIGPLDPVPDRPSYAAGGTIPPAPGDNITPQQFGALRAINPPGPDDQIGALKTGEGVLTVSAMRQYPGLLAAANAGTLDPGRVKGLLTPAGMGRKPRLVR